MSQLESFIVREEHRKFVFEVFSVIMFVVSLATLRVPGKRGIKQSVFEVGVE